MSWPKALLRAPSGDEVSLSAMAPSDATDVAGTDGHGLRNGERPRAPRRGASVGGRDHQHRLFLLTHAVDLRIPFFPFREFGKITFSSNSETIS